MAKDTEKLIRQLSLISFLMAERRPVSALEIKQDVEGYSQMNDEAFARRFYADRAELDSLGIELKVDKPSEGFYEAENYSLPPENFYLPAIEFTDRELGSLRTALSLLDGEFAYAEPLRLALQQLSWGKPSPLNAPETSSVALAVTASPGGRELSQRLSKIETAIFRRKTILFDYYTIGRDAEEARKVDPYHLLFRGGQFYLIGYSHERDADRVFRISRIRGKVGYSSKAEHDFSRPEDFDPRIYATRTDWQLGDTVGTARVWISDRIDWLVLRHFGHAGEVEHTDDGVIFETPYGDSRQLISWVLGLGGRARVLDPPELAEEAEQRLRSVVEGHEESPELAKPVQPPPGGRRGGARRPPRRGEHPPRALRAAGDPGRPADRGRPPGREARPARAVLEPAAHRGRAQAGHRRAERRELRRRLLRALRRGPGRQRGGRPRALRRQLRPPRPPAAARGQGAGGRHRPDRRAPARGRAEQRPPEGGRRPGRGPRGRGPPDHHRPRRRLRGGARDERRDRRPPAGGDRVLQGERGRVHERTIEPYKLLNGQEGWYVHCYDLERDGPRSFRLDRIREVTALDETFEPRDGIEPDVSGWPSTGEVPESRPARVWISPERARWAREDRRVVDELADGAVVVELQYAGGEWLAREILKEAGDAVVLEPEEARQAVLDAATELAGAPR